MISVEMQNSVLLWSLLGVIGWVVWVSLGNSDRFKK